jgi:hypothetical protein
MPRLVRRNGEWQTPTQMVESLERSLRVLGTDYIDVFQLHGVPISAYTYARETLVPKRKPAVSKRRRDMPTALLREARLHLMQNIGNPAARLSARFLPAPMQPSGSSPLTVDSRMCSDCSQLMVQPAPGRLDFCHVDDVPLCRSKLVA